MNVSLKIPENAACALTEKDHVDFDSILFIKNITQHEIINVAKTLSIKPNEIYKFINHVIGDKINIGDLIAQKSNIFSTKKVFSDYSGKVIDIDHKAGNITLSTTKEKGYKIKSFFKGKIKTVEQSFIIADIDIINDYAIEKSNSDGGGEIYVINNNDNFFNVNENQVKNKIIFIENMNINILVKIAALGATGAVCNNFDNDDSIPIWKPKDATLFNKIPKINCKYVIISSSDSKLYLYN
jgi:hypothetical protein